MKQAEVRVTHRRTICQAVWAIDVETSGTSQTIAPGQFFLVAGPSYLRRPVWPSRFDERSIEFMVDVGRDLTDAWLISRSVGDVLDTIGPLGHGFDPANKGERVLLVAQSALNVGPLLPLLSQALDVGAEVLLLTAATHSRRLYPRSELPPAVELQVATADGSLGHRGSITDLIADVLPWADRVAAAGDRQLYTAMKAAGIAQSLAGSEVCQVLLTDVALVCGVGACQACAVLSSRGTTLACQQGPVFALADLAPQLDQSAVEDHFQ